MENLNQLEISLLKQIIEENKVLYPWIEKHLSKLKVKDRVFTGVGVFTNFEYLSNTDTPKIDILLSSSKSLFVDNLQNELSYQIDITDGEIKYLEIVTNGNELWDGSFKKFKLNNNS